MFTLIRVTMLAKIIVCCAVLCVVLSCRTIRDVEVNAILKDGSPLIITLNSCIERRAFLDGNKTRNVAEIDIYQQHIPRLEKDSIRHLMYLRKLTIRDSDLKILDMDIFRNTPRLETVDFISNKIEVIRDGVYNYQDFRSVSLYNNQINSMDDLAFSNMSLLKRVNVSYNNLTEFKGSWFYLVPNLTTIDFQHNFIETLPSKAFGNMTTIKNIYLNHNNLANIAPNAFEGLRWLNFLDLRHNLLKTMDLNNFPEIMKINSLYINANRFNALKESLLRALSVNTISLDGNPWNCLCHMNMNKLLEKTGTKVILSPECRDETIPVCALGNLTECVEEHSDYLTNFYYQTFVHQKDSACVRYFD